MDTFYLGAAEGTAWPLSVGQVDNALHERYGQIATRRGHARIAGADYLEADIPIGGTHVPCLYSDHFSLTLTDCGPDAATQILIWFLPLMPTGTPTVAMTDTNPTPTPLPETLDPQSLQTFLARLTH